MGEGFRGLGKEEGGGVLETVDEAFGGLERRREERSAGL